MTREGRAAWRRMLRRIWEIKLALLTLKQLSFKMVV